MRIVGGRNKGRSLKVAKKGTRPTKGIVRESIFNILGSLVVNAHILDVFAGSGALGIEAICRGACNCVFIETNARSLMINIDRFKIKDKCEVLKYDFRRSLKKLKGRKFDIVFLDPPYHRDYVDQTLILLHNCDLASGVVIVEHHAKETINLPGEWQMIKHKKHGETAISVIDSKPESM
ncbi:16S rRNA (guanine(966)-N(2))-methyltransferase RsmD [candidate division WOR-3 bacterium RBG_13_43_14]|uniref:16S rRNA (Guanine(966)-N(2))-methyltransferase RsmD n=1 Tax=candidate division WOR-3 bacterium RBG_13_43_14 TaxID=1802590 RepID=A0A1F4UAZ7_UNCW3|nr:MAG: 16S rRNA (guanine(966)-N(2))-methyltransferase RsmD [candidate division WOR-3 bacterium RBG_13_43_14]